MPRMAKAVDAALHELVAKHGKLSAKQAVDYVNNPKKTNATSGTFIDSECSPLSRAPHRWRRFQQDYP
jgi:hypothetical protein